MTIPARESNKESAEEERAPERFGSRQDNRRANDFRRIRTNRRLERFSQSPTRLPRCESHRGPKTPLATRRQHRRGRLASAAGFARAPRHVGRDFDFLLVSDLAFSFRSRS